MRGPRSRFLCESALVTLWCNLRCAGVAPNVKCHISGFHSLSALYLVQIDFPSARQGASGWINDRLQR